MQNDNYKKLTFKLLKQDAVRLYTQENKSLDEVKEIMLQWDLDGNEFHEIMTVLYGIKPNTRADT